MTLPPNNPPSEGGHLDSDMPEELAKIFVPEDVPANAYPSKAISSSKPAKKRKNKRKTSIFGEIVGLLGELLLSAGAFLLLFVVWQLWWTDVVSEADADVATQEIQNVWDDPYSDWVTPKKKTIGNAYALIRIPRFGEKFVWPIYEGTDPVTLRRGVGHYVETVDPGEIGNFSMAGHRTTYGKPFNQITTLKPGDKIIIETKEFYFIYEITDFEIVDPGDGEVVWPVPHESDAVPTKALLTMTSCHPDFSSQYRYIQHGIFVEKIERGHGLPPELWQVQE